jgi:hypothetical protein
VRPHNSGRHNIAWNLPKQAAVEHAVKQAAAGSDKAVSRAEQIADQTFNTKTMAITKVVHNAANADDIFVKILHGTGYIPGLQATDQIVCDTTFAQKIANRCQARSRTWRKRFNHVVNGTIKPGKKIANATQ